MEIKMKYLIALGSVFVATSLFSQGHVIETEGSRPVEKAYRIALTPRVVDTVIPTTVVKYPLLTLKYPTETEVSMIKPAAIRMKEKLPQLYNNYAKLGVGTELMPLGEFYFGSKRSRKYMYGVHLKHLSSFGNLNGYAPAQFDRTSGELFGGINDKRYTLRGDVHYRNQGLHYYGYPSDTLFVADSIAQRYSDFGFGSSFSSHKKDSAKLNYTVGLNYNNYMSKKPTAESRSDWRARENFIGLNTNWKYKYGSETYSADLNVHYNGYKYGTVGDTNQFALDTGLVSNNTIINLHPTIMTHLQNNRFKAKIGLNLLFNVHNGTKAHIYPDIEVKYSMFNDIFIPYVGLRGGMNQTTFKSLTGENEFLLSNVRLQNENTAIDFYGGIKGTLSKRVSFNVGASFANVKNKAFFVTDTTFSLGNKFGVIYDTMNVAKIEGSISYQMSEKLKVDAIGAFNSYNVLNNTYAWNMPQVQVILRGSYNLFDKFLFNLDLDLEHGRKALVYEDGEGVTQENGQYIKDLGFIADANLGVEYRYNKRISAFLQLNNFAAQRYQRWYEAPVQPFQVMGGVTFRF
jgi:hypothetical protein